MVKRAVDEDMFADDSDSDDIAALADEVDAEDEDAPVLEDEEEEDEPEVVVAAPKKASKTRKPASKGADESVSAPKAKNVVKSKSIEDAEEERPKSKGKEVKKTMASKKSHRGTTKAVSRGAVLAGLFSKPQTLRATYHGKELKATVSPDGMIKFNGDTFTSPSGAGSSIRKGNSKVDGWHFWKIENKKGELVTLDTLRQKKSA